MEAPIRRFPCILNFQGRATCHQASGMSTRISRLRTPRPHDPAPSRASHLAAKTPTLRAPLLCGMRSQIATPRRHCLVAPLEMVRLPLDITPPSPMDGALSVHLYLRSRVHRAKPPPTGLPSGCVQPAVPTSTTTTTTTTVICLSRDGIWECTPCRPWTMFRCRQFLHIWQT